MQKQGKLSFENWECEYSEEGQGPLVLGLHGHLSDKSVWQACSQWFAQKGYRFVAYTQRYYGTTAWPDTGANFNRETHVNDLLNVIAALDAGPVHLLTRSYGGAIGFRAAIQQPEVFSSMVHFEPAMPDIVESHPEYPDAALMFQEFTPVSEALAAGDEESAALRFIEAAYRLEPGSAEQSLSPEIFQMIKQHGRVVAPYNAMPASEPVTTQQVANLQIPTLLVHGSESYRWFSLINEELEKVLPNASLYVMDGLTHNGAAARPEEFCEQALKLIASA